MLVHNKRRGSAVASRRKRWKPGLTAVVVAIIAYILLAGDEGLLAIRRQWQALEVLDDRLLRERVKRDSLANILHRMRSDLDYVEKIAREELGMVKQGEYLYRLSPATDEPPLP